MALNPQSGPWRKLNYVKTKSRKSRVCVPLTKPHPNLAERRPNLAFDPSISLNFCNALKIHRENNIFLDKQLLTY